MSYLIIIWRIWLVLFMFIVYFKHKQSVELWYTHYKEFHDIDMNKVIAEEKKRYRRDNGKIL